MDKRRLLIINEYFGYTSTGRIALDIAREYDEDGYEVRVAYGRKPEIPPEAEKYAYLISGKINVYLHGIYTRLTDKHGLASRAATRRFIKWAEEFNPGLLWLHNLHGYYINYEMLFDWIKSRPQMKVKWTLHDCWTFTGHCAHFIYIGCDKWKTQCEHCPQLDQYPKSMRDNSYDNYQRKKKAFTGVEDLTIVTPSVWLSNMVKESFLAEYPVEVVCNTVDREAFKPACSSFKDNNGFADKKMILGVANVWNDRKGLGDFIKLDNMLDPEHYQIVLVGLDKEQIENLSQKDCHILPLSRTNNVSELVEIYNAADYFVNMTYEDTFPTVNLEAEACGTPVITYDVGGCAETISLEESRLVERGNVAAVAEVIKNEQ
ncbi:glycosyltransferase [Butyrivibrio sp. MC2013]|uniref:glycosyltransferase n=1 Tax=Butyrivibrio sp. MC2013 TaxID=1280686 RepID=UPI000418D15F|nr:glycosyltransferase [Butyrivibrio sp. MC2013]